jgi:hypothetical protein
MDKQYTEIYFMAEVYGNHSLYTTVYENGVTRLNALLACAHISVCHGLWLRLLTRLKLGLRICRVGSSLC